MADNHPLELAAFTAKIWEQGHALYRDLPWRNTRDPYAIWISEVMLQQTQVSRVDGRWQRWLERFDSVEALAGASLSDVLGEWQGMGYNNRAKRLQECAQRIMECHGGSLPRAYDDLVALPGIGPATAAGIRAFAFNEPGVYLETNVRTVFIHELFANQDAVDDKQIIPLVEAACPATGGDVRGWYYALLDYGAYLKKTHPNPSRKSRQHTRQSKFEGSHRQKRAFVLRCLLDGPKSVDAVAAALDAFELSCGRPAAGPDELAGILAELEREQMICQAASGTWQIAG